MREVRSGGSLAVTERGEHIATISPKAKAGKEEAFVMSFSKRKQGLIRRGRGKLSKFRAVRSKGKPASEIIIEDRK
jgi:antitoxin (DNA-binding transcriptional repressor) of toxin-antitoxin stability system